jgi:hypothetical protein
MAITTVVNTDEITVLAHINFVKVFLFFFITHTKLFIISFFLDVLVTDIAFIIALWLVVHLKKNNNS